MNAVKSHDPHHKQPFVCNASAMKNDVIHSRGKPGIAYRLTLTREAMGYDQGAFAQRAGLAANTYNQYETGKNAPNMEAAHKL